MVASEEQFHTTRWTLVLEAGGASEAGKQQALARLCGDYWKPVFAYIRRHGRDEHAARDLTQEFFARLLEKEWLAGLERNGTPFRAFLLTLLKRFLTGEFRRERALKRGGDLQALSMDWTEAPSLADEALSPDDAFDRQWSLSVIHQAIERLQLEAVASGKTALFVAVSPFLASPGEPHAAAAAEAGLSSGAFAMAVHRQRLRLRELIRAVVAETLTDRSQVEEEVRHLMAALRR